MEYLSIIHELSVCECLINTAAYHNHLIISKKNTQK